MMNKKTARKGILFLVRRKKRISPRMKTRISKAATNLACSGGRLVSSNAKLRGSSGGKSRRHAAKVVAWVKAVIFMELKGGAF